MATPPTSYDWFQKTITGLSLDENVVNSLAELKIALSSLNVLPLRYVSSSINLVTVFDCLNTSAENQIELTCDVLKTFLSALKPSFILSEYDIPLARALKHPHVKVKLLALSELNRVVSECGLTEGSELLLPVVELVGHEDVSVARQSIKVLVQLGKSPPGLQALYSSEVLNALLMLSKTNDINNFRVYEIAVEVSVDSEAGLEASVSSGILNSLLGELKRDDMLVLLNILQFVTKLALTPHGFNFLESNGVIGHLAVQLSLLEGNPLAPLLLPGLTKFFGNVAHFRPRETLQDYPKVMNSIFSFTMKSDPGLVCVALETIGYIGTTSPGKHTLHKQESLMDGFMKRVWEVSTKWQPEHRIRGLNTLANLTRLEISEQDTEMLSIVSGWFGMLGPNREVMTKVMEMVQQPFSDIKLAALLLVQVLAEQPWGQGLIHNTPGMVELFLDRDSDTNMEVKSARFTLVKTLAESPTSETAFGEEMVKRFTKYLQEGPVYVQFQTEVAIEKAN